MVTVWSCVGIVASWPFLFLLAYVGARYPDRIPGPRVIWADWRYSRERKGE